MSADIITSENFWIRIGSERERPDDRRLWSAMEMWHWQAAMKEAKARGDHFEVDRLNRAYEQINGI